MMRSRCWILALCPLLWACGDDPAERAVEENVPDMSPSQSTPSAAEESVSETTSVREDYLVRLVPVEGQTLNGSAALAPQGERTEVTVRLTGAAEGTYQGHVHQGDTCDQIGEVTFPLEPVNAAAGGEGESTSTLTVALDSVMTGNTLVVFHQAGGSPGQPAVCGDVPRLPANLPQ